MVVVETTPTTSRGVVEHLCPRCGDKVPTVSFVLDADELLGHRACTGQHWRLESFKALLEFLHMIVSITVADHLAPVQGEGAAVDDGACHGPRRVCPRACRPGSPPARVRAFGVERHGIPDVDLIVELLPVASSSIASLSSL